MRPVMQEAQPVLCFNLEGGEGGGKRERPVYTYGWYVLMCGRSQHDIVKQLFSN